jgi:thiamine pyrophosphate-dependent acetolactate synthase large subunit-like protein
VKQERRDYPYIGTALDYTVPPAHYFGVRAVAADTPGALEDALRRALAAEGPTVIEAAVDASHYSETVYD